jgi:hypothetical protein
MTQLNTFAISELGFGVVEPLFVVSPLLDGLFGVDWPTAALVEPVVPCNCRRIISGVLQMNLADCPWIEFRLQPVVSRIGSLQRLQFTSLN